LIVTTNILFFKEKTKVLEIDNNHPKPSKKHTNSKRYKFSHKKQKKQ